MLHNGFSIDIEGDGLVFDVNNIWVINLEDLDTEDKLQLHPFRDQEAKQKLLDWASKYDCPNICFHNGLGYDIFALLFVLGIDFNVLPDTFAGQKVQFVDTFYLSMFLNPDRERHSIEYFGAKFGKNKINFREKLVEIGALDHQSPDGAEFLQYHQIMDEYCERDTLIGKMTYKSLLNEWVDIYGSFNGFPDFFKVGQKTFYLMSCQELSGWKFDVNLAHELVTKIQGMMEEIRSDVEPTLPPRKLKKTEEKDYKMPAKPFKKDGTLASSMEKWIVKHNAKLITNNTVEAYGKIYVIEADKQLDIKLPMEMANQDQMKDWFLEMGWSPTLWNYKRGEDGKPVRDPITRQLIPTSPKIQEAGKLCQNLEKMEGDLIKKVVKWLSLRNRLSVLSGWLSNPRLQYDGRIGAGRTGIAASHRQKHKVVVNVPKASEKVLLGKEFRSLWTSEDGYWIAAGDSCGLEGRVQGHYTWKYDNGATATELLDGDIHSKTAKSVYAKELANFDINSPDFSKDDPVFKPYRDRSKNVFYATLYGAGDAKIASTAGLPESKGKEVAEKFWAANQATKQLKDNLEKYWETKGRKKYLPAIDGRILITRKKSALLNTIFQSCGGISMDYAGLFLDKWLGGIKFDNKRRPYYLYKGMVVRRIGYVHDELEFECEGEEIATEVAKLIEKAIAKSGEYLKMNIPLAGEGKVGKNWKETH